MCFSNKNPFNHCYFTAALPELWLQLWLGCSGAASWQDPGGCNEMSSEVLSSPNHCVILHVLGTLTFNVVFSSCAILYSQRTDTPVSDTGCCMPGERFISCSCGILSLAGPFSPVTLSWLNKFRLKAGLFREEGEENWAFPSSH